MAAVTKAQLDNYIETFHTSIASGDLDAAEDALLSAEACLQAMPDTEQLKFHGSLKSLREMLEARWRRHADRRPRRLLMRRPGA